MDEIEYDVELNEGLDIYQKNAVTIILSKIRPGSKVLEFGPAYGRMTRFLKENLQCHVSCVEINARAQEKLELYSEKVVIGDIETGEWKKEFKEKSFDYIIFADVLEHLLNPNKVLEDCKKFLNKKGSIYFSIPNIAHTAIILSLLDNKFTYQDYGILDRTHLRFFSKESIESMIKSCGFHIVERDATYYLPEMTGIIKDEKMFDMELISYLNDRPYALVYQYIYGVSLDKTINFIDNLEKKEEINIIKIFYDEAIGFDEKLTNEKKCVFQIDRVSKIAKLKTQLDLNKEEGKKKDVLIAELESKINSIKKEDDEKNVKIAQLDAQLNLCKIEGKEKNILIAELEAMNNLIKKENNEKNAKIAELEAQLINVSKESEERAIKCAELQYHRDYMKDELEKKNLEIFHKNLHLLKESTIWK